MKWIAFQFIALFTFFSLFFTSHQWVWANPGASKQSRFKQLFTADQPISSLGELNRLLKMQQPFESHINPDMHFGTYLIHKVNFAPANRIKKIIEKLKDLELTDRGEAHITVLTPPEHDAIKAAIPEFSMEKVNEAVKNWIQFTDWKVLGVGAARGQNFQNKYTEVYFLVVKSKELRFVRNLIARMYRIPKNIFDPKKQDFHITLGFTESDMFGIPKDGTSLDSDLTFEKLFNARL